MPAAGIPLYVTAHKPAMSCADHRTPGGALAIGRRRRGRPGRRNFSQPASTGEGEMTPKPKELADAA